MTISPLTDHNVLQCKSGNRTVGYVDLRNELTFSFPKDWFCDPWCRRLSTASTVMNNSCRRRFFHAGKRNVSRTGAVTLLASRPCSILATDRFGVMLEVFGSRLCLDCPKKREPSSLSECFISLGQTKSGE